MAFQITGLNPDLFKPLIDLSATALAERGVQRKTVDAKPGYPCRITLEDAPVGETVLLLNYESHAVSTPYRHAFAIYVREHAHAAAQFENALPPVMSGRPIALRFFDADGQLVGADMFLDEAAGVETIKTALDRPDVAYIHAHNAKHGCFSAEIRPL